MGKLKLKEKVTMASLLIALGIIYGDIGTSPLYTFKAIVGDRQISEMLVLGGVSCIFWTLFLQTTVKYIWITLKADNEGEGGIFVLYSLVRKFGKFLIIPTMIGASALLADGIIAPAISVSSAIEGFKNIKGLESFPTIPFIILVITMLFFFQRYGTHNLGRAFGPAMFIWFSMLATLGMIQILQFPSVFKAINPVYAYELLSKYPGGFVLLGGVFLATTGAESLYSDLGHCGRKNIRITWGLVKTCLVLNYMGQAAWMLRLGENAFLDGRNPFFELMPGWFLIVGIIISTVATSVASQALISGSYTLINEAINLNLWPRVTIRQPSEVKGQMYIPSVNILLWVGSVLIVLFFQTSSNMEAAYGLAITITMLVTTYLLSFYLMYRLKWNKIIVFTMVGLFATIETSFFIANIHKFPEGGYITLIITVFFSFIMYTIHSGRKKSNQFTKFVDIRNHVPLIQDLSNDETFPKFSTHLIYLTKANRRHEIEEKIIKSIFDKKPKRADVYWFVHINRTEHPYTLTYDVSELVDDMIIKVNINVGFRVQARTELFFKKIVQELVDNEELNLHNRADGSSKYNKDPDFKFVVIERFLSVENDLSIKDGILLNTYFRLKRLGQSDETAFGLEKSDVIMEYTPLLYQAARRVDLQREQKSC